MSPHTPARRRTATTAIIAAVIVAPALAPVPAQADDCKLPGGLFCNPRSSKTGSSGGGGGTGGGGAGPVAPPDMVVLELVGDEGGDVSIVPGETPTPAAPRTFQLVEEAMSSKAFPVPTVHTAPDGKTYVRIRTSLWVDGFEVVRTDPVSAGDQTVQATAEPVSVTWDLGEKNIVCQDAGSKNGKSCNYAYKRSSSGQPGGKYQITATITWNVTWTCEGAECDSDGGDLGQQTSTSQPTPLVVSEIQTNTGQ